MNPEEYMKNALKTEAMDFPKIKERLQDTRTVRILHAAIGIATESGELLDEIKKHIYYGKYVDWVNLKEELGDLLWYMNILMDAVDTTYEEVAKANVEKLRLRYEGKLTETKAINRDLEKERKSLEKNLKKNRESGEGHFDGCSVV